VRLKEDFADRTVSMSAEKTDVDVVVDRGG
jgi:hypothetical protein